MSIDRQKAADDPAPENSQVLSKDAQGQGLPISNGEGPKAMQDARGHKSGATKGQPERTEARCIFR